MNSQSDEYRTKNKHELQVFTELFVIPCKSDSFNKLYPLVSSLILILETSEFSRNKQEFSSYISVLIQLLNFTFIFFKLKQSKIS